MVSVRLILYNTAYGHGSLVSVRLILYNTAYGHGSLVSVRLLFYKTASGHSRLVIVRLIFDKTKVTKAQHSNLQHRDKQGLDFAVHQNTKVYNDIIKKVYNYINTFNTVQNN